MKCAICDKEHPSVNLWDEICELCLLENPALIEILRNNPPKEEV